MDNKIFRLLIKLTKKAMKKKEAPIAAVIVLNKKIIAKAYNKRNSSNITMDHAEIKAIQAANKKIKNWRLNKCTLYVTLEPCEMCKSVIKESRIEKVIYLLSRDIRKKQYNKTVFEPAIINSENIQILENYKKQLREFWENKR